jgi:hypothetical protein
MKILNVRFRRFMNGEHYEFIKEIIVLVEKFGAETLDVEIAFRALVQQFDKEQQAMAPIMKSPFTALINQAEKIRNTTFRGLKKRVKSSLQHFDPEVREAAAELIIAFKIVGRINRTGKSNDLAHVAELVEYLQGSYAEDAAKVGITEWVEQLDTENKGVRALIKQRYEDWNARPTLRMTDVRTEVDASYHILIGRVQALLMLSPSDTLIAFIKELNLRVQHYNTIVKERESHNVYKRRDLSCATISTIPIQLYAGGAHITPLVEVFYENNKLTEGRDYTVAYLDNVQNGTATVIIRAKGEYTGKKVTTFNIVMALP